MLLHLELIKRVNSRGRIFLFYDVLESVADIVYRSLPVVPVIYICFLVSLNSLRESVEVVFKDRPVSAVSGVLLYNVANSAKGPGGSVVRAGRSQ